MTDADDAMEVQHSKRAGNLTMDPIWTIINAMPVLLAIIDKQGSSRPILLRPSPPPPLRQSPAAAEVGVIGEIAAERQRQIDKERWTPEHDDGHIHGELADAAACYAATRPLILHRTSYHGEPGHVLWPWDRDWWKPKSRRRDLVRAGALIIAEIERLDRASTDTAERAQEEDK